MNVVGSDSRVWLGLTAVALPCSELVSSERDDDSGGGRVATRVGEYLETRKQRRFPRDFIEGWEDYETWDTVEIGRSNESSRRFVVAEEDVLSYNRALGETDPLMVDPDYAREHSPTGRIVAHPLFLTTIIFFVSTEGIGTWVRTPGARNPGQRIEILEPVQVGDEVEVTSATVDRWIRRDKHYITSLSEFSVDGRLVARWWGTLIIPPTREAVRAFAEAMEAAR